MCHRFKRYPPATYFDSLFSQDWWSLREEKVKMKKALLLLLLLLLLGRGLLLLLLLLLLGQDLLLLESDLLATQSHLRLLVHLCSFLLTALTRWIHHDMFTWCWMGFDIKILKTQVTGKTGLTVSLFCCLGLEDKNLRVGGGGQVGG